jgi:integrase
MDPINPGEYLIYQRPLNGSAGSWSARSYDKGTGRQVQNRLGTADDFSDANGDTILTFLQAQEKAKVWFKQCHDMKKAAEIGEVISILPYTVANAVQDYLDDGKRRGMKALDRTEMAAKAHILPSLGSIEVTKLTRVKIESWLSKLSESARRVRSKVGAKPAFAADPKSDDEKRARKDSANRILTILKAALNHALDREKVGGSGDAWRRVKPYAGVTSARIRYLTIEEQQRLVVACPLDFQRLVQAALFTGARYGELTRLKVNDFDPQGGTIFVAESKSGKARRVRLTVEALNWFKSQVEGKPSNDLLFTRSEVKRRGREDRLENTASWAHSDQQRPMEVACKKAELEPIRFHELRHSYASGLVNGGIPLAFIAQQLGHSDERMVSKHYGHLAPDALATAIRTLAPQLGIAGPIKSVLSGGAAQAVDEDGKKTQKIVSQ